MIFLCLGFKHRTIQTPAIAFRPFYCNNTLLPEYRILLIFRKIGHSFETGLRGRGF